MMISQMVVLQCDDVTDGGFTVMPQNVVLQCDVTDGGFTE